MTDNQIFELAALKQRAKNLKWKIKRAACYTPMHLAEIKIDLAWAEKAIKRLEATHV